MTDRPTLQSFFQTYARALAAGNLPAVAACYEVPAFVIGDQAAVPVPDPKTVEAAFAGAAERYRAQGLVDIAPEITGVDEVTPRMTLVALTWSYLDAARKAHRQSRYRYLVRTDDAGTPRIRVVISVAE